MQYSEYNTDRGNAHDMTEGSDDSSVDEDNGAGDDLGKSLSVYPFRFEQRSSSAQTHGQGSSTMSSFHVHAHGRW